MREEEIKAILLDFFGGFESTIAPNTYKSGIFYIHIGQYSTITVTPDLFTPEKKYIIPTHVTAPLFIQGLENMLRLHNFSLAKRLKEAAEDYRRGIESLEAELNHSQNYPIRKEP